VQRFGNTKTFGVVRGEFTVLPDLPAHLRQGGFRDATDIPRVGPLLWSRAILPTGPGGPRPMLSSHQGHGCSGPETLA
jgi:hypothetical protein